MPGAGAAALQPTPAPPCSLYVPRPNPLPVSFSQSVLACRCLRWKALSRRCPSLCLAVRPSFKSHPLVRACVRVPTASASPGTLGVDSSLACSGALSRAIFPEMWGDCAARYMAAAAASGRSTHGFNLLPTIIKAGDDLIQEAFALQVRCAPPLTRVLCV
jgi:hypothetical protein